MRRLQITATFLAALAVSACRLQEAPRPDTAAAIAQASGFRGGWNQDAWRAPIVDSTPDDPLEQSIYRGLALITNTHDSLPSYVSGSLNCVSCHLDGGRHLTSAPLVGVFARYPKYMDRTGAVVPIEDRVNYCFTRSLAGSKIPSDSREMQDIVAYLAYISKGVPNGEHLRTEGLAKMPRHIGDSTRGRAIFVDNCARCHASDGSGMGPIPALWGRRSFSVGASMARQERAASFIRFNMPLDRPGTLSDQQAFDVAAYITAMPRPDSPGKDRDYPAGDAPADTPYDTKGHRAFHPPALLPRLNPAGAIVAAPAPVRNRN